MKKRSLVFFLLILTVLFTQAAFAELPLDISGSTYVTQNATTFRIHDVAIVGYTAATFWIDFQWDKNLWVFVPVNAGAEPVATGHTWSWVVGSSSTSFLYTLTSHPETKTFTVSYKTQSGTPFICQAEGFLQVNNQFNISTSSYAHDNDTALITYTSAFGGCGYIYSGQTLSATISYIPSWFDFRNSFMIGFGAEPMVCEPDGSHHK